ncbi:MAG: Wzz/FepE/Etk N-terminal domain-containing protein [Eubacteriales bacterium]|nr:Wzz/FepE/Etk N-terminal domain-containing protein [Eubacteriales bacterium]
MNKDQQVEYMEIDLLQVLKELWKRAGMIALVSVLCGALAFGYAALLVTPKYQSSALLYVNNSSFTGNTSYSISSSELTAAQHLVDTYVVILKSRTTLEDVIERSGVAYDYEELTKMISAESVNSTEMFKVTVTSEDPQEAMVIANTIADVLPDKIASVVEGSSIRIVDRAVVADEKSSPNITRYTMIGVLLGLVASCFVVVLMVMFDDLIKDEDYLTQTYDVPVLAVIPDLLGKGSDGYYRQGGYYQMESDRRDQDAAH